MSKSSFQAAILARIAADNGADVESLSLATNGAVLHRRGRELLCLCQAGSQYWNELEAGIIAVRVIDRARTRHDDL